MTVYRRIARRVAPLLLLLLSMACQCNMVKLQYQVIGTMNPATKDTEDKTPRELFLRAILMPESKLDWFRKASYEDLMAEEFKSDKEQQVLVADLKLRPRSATGSTELPTWDIGERGPGTEALGIVANFNVRDKDEDWRQCRTLSDMSDKVLRIEGHTIKLDVVKKEPRQ